MQSSGKMLQTYDCKIVQVVQWYVGSSRAII
uniref:Uncharacterized protein n=1 Tax=virus sp. ct6Ax4 TaxID=2826791 RepID=A0A8S5R7B3_9VIRU|nr:MAG TPA: hypothetical protein [virus sp. ct6Ax4]DAH37452.1 MAG TPA: hypothetical protein [Caudoviricetes sp.]DAX22963.1 MAG TPA: hypothetical protein [Caudoviricetes sp.]